MRDLYARLGVEPKASVQEIRNARANCSNSSLNADVNAVLLVPSRRKHYDRVHATLKDIGSLRTHLGLNHSDNWQGSEADDFSTDPIHAPSLHSELMKKINHLNKKSKTDAMIDSIKAFVRGVYCLGGIALFVWIVVIWDDSAKTSSSSNTSYSAPKQPVSKIPATVTKPKPLKFDHPSLLVPASGTIRRHTTVYGIAPLEIKTSSGSNYLVKLEDISTGINILDVFIRGGSTVNIEVPLGTYRLKYAAGQTWYGYKYYFGPSTSYSKADSTFRFYDDGYQVSGYTVTLYQVLDGNLSTSRLSPSQF